MPDPLFPNSRQVPWPEPLLQPDSHRDCSFYSVAYLAHCLGYPDVTPQDVMRWREYTRKHEDRFCGQALGCEWVRIPWGDRPGRQPFYMGPDGKDWVIEHLDAGWLAVANLHRVDPIGHNAVLLDYDPDRVLLMDPLYGFKHEPWEWFLGPGPGMHKPRPAHRIEGWCRRG